MQDKSYSPELQEQTITLDENKKERPTTKSSSYK